MNETIQKLLNDFSADIKSMNIHNTAAKDAQTEFRRLARKSEQEDVCDYDDAMSEAASVRNSHSNEAIRLEIRITNTVEKVIRGTELAEFWTEARKMI